MRIAATAGGENPAGQATRADRGSGRQARSLLTGRRRPATLFAPLHDPLPPPHRVNDSENPAPAADTWEGILAALRRRYPGQKDSVLFCIYKLQHNSELTLRDFRAEAELHGIPMAGRSLHSARILLGLQKTEAASAPALEPIEPIERPARRRPRDTAPADDGGASIETRVLAAVRQIQSAAGAESDQLRAAIRQAIAILQKALGS